MAGPWSSAEARRVEDDLGPESRSRGSPPCHDGDNDAGRRSAERRNGKILGSVSVEKNRPAREEPEDGKEQSTQVLGRQENPEPRQHNPLRATVPSPGCQRNRNPHPQKKQRMEQENENSSGPQECEYRHAVSGRVARKDHEDDGGVEQGAQRGAVPSTVRLLAVDGTSRRLGPGWGEHAVLASGPVPRRGRGSRRSRSGAAGVGSRIAHCGRSVIDIVGVVDRRERLVQRGGLLARHGRCGRKISLDLPDGRVHEGADALQPSLGGELAAQLGVGGVELDHPLELDVAQRNGKHGEIHRRSRAQGDGRTDLRTMTCPSRNNGLQRPGDERTMTTTGPQPHSQRVENDLRIPWRIHGHGRPGNSGTAEHGQNKWQHPGCARMSNT